MLHTRFMNHRVLVRALLAAVMVCVFISVEARAAGSPVELVSDTGSGGGNDHSSIISSNFVAPNVRASSVSADGRYVVFESRASNIPPNDNNDSLDVYVHDRTSGTTSLVSINNMGTGRGNGESFNAIISANGRFVVFQTRATNLVTDGPTGKGLVVRDLVAGTTMLVTVNSEGTESSIGSGTNQVVSDDGRYIAFQSSTKDLVTVPDPTEDFDIFLRDMIAGTTVMVSVNSAGTASATGNCLNPSISADGRYVAFDGGAPDLAPNDNNSEFDVFVWDRLAAAPPELLSINHTGTATGNHASANSVISSNGRYVAFQSQASDLTTNDIDTTPDVFVRDLVMDTTVIVSMNSANTSGGNGQSLNPSISGNGRYIAFDSLALNLVPNDQNGVSDIFVRDIITNTTTLVTVNNEGTSSSIASGTSFPVISDDGRFIAFFSGATDLVPPYTEFAIGTNIFVRDRVAGVTILASVNSQGTATGNSEAYAPQISDDGSVVVFHSTSSDLVPNDTDPGAQDVFAAPLNLGTAHFSAAAYTVNEQSATATITLTRTGGTTGAISVHYATEDGSATAGQDYTAVSGTLTFAAGQTTRTFNVPIKNDLISEPDETLNLRLSLAMNSLPSAPSLARLTIISNDPQPQISINNVSVTEGNSGIVNAVFNVKISNQSSQTVLVSYATSDGTAQANVDYTPTSGTLSFAPGQLIQTVTVQVFSDTLDEANLTFNVNLTAPTNAALADAQGVGTIIDNDPAPSLRINDMTVIEGNSGMKNVTFTVLSSAVSGQAVTVHYATANGTATAGSDYNSSAGTLVIPAGSTSKTIVLSVKGDTLDESDETFFVNLTAPTNATIFDGKGMGVITDNDPTPNLRINNVSVTEGDSATTNAVLTVTLSAMSGQTVKVNYATANGTAGAPADYQTKTGLLTFAPGETTKTIAVVVKGDTVHETNETFFVNLSTPVNASISDGQGQGVITNDD